MQGTASQGFIRTIVYGPDVTGINGATMAAARDSNWMGCAGMGQVTVTLDLTRSATTTLTFQVRIRTKVTTSGITGPTRILDIAEQSTGTGTVTYYNFTANRAASTTGVYDFTLPAIAADEFQIYQVTGTSAGGSDVISLYAICQGVGA